MDGKSEQAMVTIRIGAGRTKYGKILDRETHWYTLDQKDHAINDAVESGKKIYVSVKNRAFEEITLQQLKEL